MRGHFVHVILGMFFVGRTLSCPWRMQAGGGMLDPCAGGRRRLHLSSQKRLLRMVDEDAGVTVTFRVDNDPAI